MDFITTEQFLKQPKEVQNVINNSIKLNIGDRIYHKLSKKYYIYLGEYNEAFWNVFDLEDKCTSVICKDYFCRCLCERQLRKFIEDKTGGKVEFYPDVYHGEHYYTIIIRETGCGGDDPAFEPYADDVLQAYWQVVVQIAKESIDN